MGIGGANAPSGRPDLQPVVRAVRTLLQVEVLEGDVEHLGAVGDDDPAAVDAVRVLGRVVGMREAQRAALAAQEATAGCAHRKQKLQTFIRVPKFEIKSFLFLMLFLMLLRNKEFLVSFLEKSRIYILKYPYIHKHSCCMPFYSLDSVSPPLPFKYPPSPTCLTSHREPRKPSGQSQEKRPGSPLRVQVPPLRHGPEEQGSTTSQLRPGEWC